MDIMSTTLVFDAADMAAESSFWAAVLGGTVEADPVEDDWHDVIVGGKTVLGVQLAPDHVPPQWPDGGHSQQVHLDLHVADIRAADAEVRALGARVLREAGLSGKAGFVVYADPAGHPFCLCWG